MLLIDPGSQARLVRAVIIAGKRGGAGTGRPPGRSLGDSLPCPRWIGCEGAVPNPFVTGKLAEVPRVRVSGC